MVRFSHSIHTEFGMMADDVQVHFGCRSGKDRTGLVDIEVRLLFTLFELDGRIPSYREQEQFVGIEHHRKTMLLESGNINKLIATSLGAEVKGSAPMPSKKASVSFQEIQKEMYLAAEGTAAIASRPKTGGRPVKSGFEELFTREANPIKDQKLDYARMFSFCSK